MNRGSHNESFKAHDALGHAKMLNVKALLKDLQSFRQGMPYDEEELGDVVDSIVTRVIERRSSPVERGAHADLGCLLDKLHAQPTVNRTLDALLAEAEYYGFGAIRFYHKEDGDTDTSLVSIDCAGLTDEVARRIRIGHIVKFAKKSPLATHDSFWCFHRCEPVIFQLDDSLEGQLEKTHLPCRLLLIRIKENQCDNVVAKHSPSFWVDFPLRVAGRFVGKLSCDLKHGDLHDTATAAIKAFSTLCNLLAPYLDALYYREHQQPLNTIAPAIEKLRTLDDLYQYAAYELPRLVKCKYASILLVSEDSFGDQRLILRATSFEKSQELVDHRHGVYRLDEPGLTPWIARNRIPVCLPDLGDDELRRKKLELYDPDLVWVNKIPDSDNHGDFLGVPICANGRILGVIRLTEKIGETGDAHFTTSDQVIAQRIAEKLIGPKLLTLTSMSSAVLVNSRLDLIRAIGILSTSRGRFFRTFNKIIGAFFANHGTAKKGWICKFDRKDTGAHHRLTFGSLRHGDKRLRNEICDSAMTADGCLFLHDLDPLREERQVVEHAVCALSRRIDGLSGPRGCLTVISSRYDLSPDTHGPILEILATEVADFFMRRDLARHLLAVLSPIIPAINRTRRQLLVSLAGTEGALTLETFDSIRRVVLSAAKQSERSGSQSFQLSMLHSILPVGPDRLLLESSGVLSLDSFLWTIGILFNALRDIALCGDRMRRAPVTVNCDQQRVRSKTFISSHDLGSDKELFLGALKAVAAGSEPVLVSRIGRGIVEAARIAADSWNTASDATAVSVEDRHDHIEVELLIPINKGEKHSNSRMT